MIKLATFGFLTGLHLALLQFCYFFLLLINVTSTYVTYAVIVVSWMAGALGGLLIPRVNVVLVTSIGVVSYYLCYALVMADPLGLVTLPIAAVGVSVTGLWAGRFFVYMLPHSASVDRLFLHENNGFLVGVIAVFVGFTLLGRAFLFWTPILSLAVLYLNLAWLVLPGRTADST